MPNNNIFFDTNVVLDIIDSTRSNNNIAKDLWRLLILKEYEIFISEDMLTTVYYININKKANLEFFKFIQNRWKIVSFGKKVISDAIKLSLEYNLDLEDTLQCLCAKENGCKIIIANDKKFYDCGINIMNYDEFLKVNNDK